MRTNYPTINVSNKRFNKWHKLVIISYFIVSYMLNHCAWIWASFGSWVIQNRKVVLILVWPLVSTDKTKGKKSESYKVKNSYYLRFLCISFLSGVILKRHTTDITHTCCLSFILLDFDMTIFTWSLGLEMRHKCKPRHELSKYNVYKVPSQVVSMCVNQIYLFTSGDRPVMSPYERRLVNSIISQNCPH